MEKRTFKRLTVNLAAEIVSGDGTVYEGLIENISESGVGYIINTVIEDPAGFVPTLKTFSMNFQTSAGETLYLDCELKRLTRPLGDKHIILGLRIIGPLTKYVEFVKGLEDVGERK